LSRPSAGTGVSGLPRADSTINAIIILLNMDPSSLLFSRLPTSLAPCAPAVPCFAAALGHGNLFRGAPGAADTANFRWQSGRRDERRRKGGLAAARARRG